MARKDGYRVGGVNAIYSIVPYIMDKRYDAMNFITVRVPQQPMHDYIKKKHDEEGLSISHLTLVVAAFVRAVSQNRFLNRYVVNKKIYARDGIWVGMVILREDGDETMTKVCFEPTDTIYDVNRKMNAMIADNRKATASNATDKLLHFLLGVPGICNFGVWFLKLLDKWGWLPKSIINASPFHVTMTVSNLASIRTNHIHHHVYEFGTTTMVLTMGNLQDIPKKVNGEIVLEKQMPIGLTMDERIGGGHQFAYAFDDFKKYLKKPELLETPPEKVDVEDFGPRRNKKIYARMAKNAAERKAEFDRMAEK